MACLVGRQSLTGSDTSVQDLIATLAYVNQPIQRAAVAVDLILFLAFYLVQALREPLLPVGERDAKASFDPVDGET